MAVADHDGGPFRREGTGARLPDAGTCGGGDEDDLSLEIHCSSFLDLVQFLSAAIGVVGGR